jgi:hypothetical protein
MFPAIGAGCTREFPVYKKDRVDNANAINPFKTHAISVTYGFNITSSIYRDVARLSTPFNFHTPSNGRLVVASPCVGCLTRQ